MSQPESADGQEISVYKEYILGVRLLEVRSENPYYRFDAPDHQRVEFEDPEIAELYADVYFDVNGFIEADTGERGIPPEIVQAGKDTLAAYLVTLPEVDVNWVASFFGRKPGQIEEYLSWVRTRAREIREGAAEQGMT